MTHFSSSLPSLTHCTAQSTLQAVQRGKERPLSDGRSQITDHRSQSLQIVVGGCEMACGVWCEPGKARWGGRCYQHKVWSWTKSETQVVMVWSGVVWCGLGHTEIHWDCATVTTCNTARSAHWSVCDNVTSSVSVRIINQYHLQLNITILSLIIIFHIGRWRWWRWEERRGEENYQDQVRFWVRHEVRYWVRYEILIKQEGDDWWSARHYRASVSCAGSRYNELEERDSPAPGHWTVTRPLPCHTGQTGGQGGTTLPVKQYQ